MSFPGVEFACCCPCPNGHQAVSTEEGHGEGGLEGGLQTTQGTVRRVNTYSCTQGVREVLAEACCCFTGLYGWLTQRSTVLCCRNYCSQSCCSCIELAADEGVELKEVKGAKQEGAEGAEQEGAAGAEQEGAEGAEQEGAKGVEPKENEPQIFCGPAHSHLWNLSKFTVGELYLFKPADTLGILNEVIADPCSSDDDKAMAQRALNYKGFCFEPKSGHGQLLTIEELVAKPSENHDVSDWAYYAAVMGMCQTGMVKDLKVKSAAKGGGPVTAQPQLFKSVQELAKEHHDLRKQLQQQLDAARSNLEGLTPGSDEHKKQCDLIKGIEFRYRHLGFGVGTGAAMMEEEMVMAVAQVEHHQTSS